MDREITLRDYGRVLWSGRWLIVASTLIAALVGLILTFLTTTTYTAKAELYLGQATSVSGTPGLHAHHEPRARPRARSRATGSSSRWPGSWGCRPSASART